MIMKTKVSSNAPGAVALTRSVNGGAVQYEPIFGDEDKGNPISCGLVAIRKGNSTTFNCPCVGFIIGLEGARTTLSEIELPY